MFSTCNASLLCLVKLQALGLAPSQLIIPYMPSTLLALVHLFPHPPVSLFLLSCYAPCPLPISCSPPTSFPLNHIAAFLAGRVARQRVRRVEAAEVADPEFAQPTSGKGRPLAKRKFSCTCSYQRHRAEPLGLNGFVCTTRLMLAPRRL